MMRKFYFILAAVFVVMTISAQVPRSFKYQAVARDGSGVVLANKAISFMISILSGSASGTTVFSETHSKTSNTFGLVDLEIGKGMAVSGNFSAINWGSGIYFIKVEMDPSGGSAYLVMGTSQLLSVPYAFFAGNVENKNDADADPANELQELQLSGTVLGLSKSTKTVTLPSSGGGDNWGTDYVRTDATLSGQGTTSLPLKIAQQSATSGQVLKWDGSAWKPATDETGTGSSLFVSSGGITYNSMLTDHFVIGSSSLNDISGSDDNIRMFFNKSKGAFRAGEPFGNDWDDSNIGHNSVAFGIGTKASGPESFAAGHIASATGPYSAALGAGTGATGMASTALGGSTKATGMESVSLGFNTMAAAKSSLAIGQYNIGSGNGTSWIATDPVFEIGIGSSESAKSNALTVLKNGNVGIGPASPTAKLEIDGQLKINSGGPGAGKVLTSDASGLASWQTPSGSGFSLPYSGSATSSQPVFEVNNTGSGFGIIARAGSLTGAVNGVRGETASSQGTGVYGYASSLAGLNNGVFGMTESSSGNAVFGLAHSISGETYAIRGEADSPDGFSGYFLGSKFYVGGNVGIGQENPGAKLEIAGQVKITGGNPGAGKVLTSDASGLASWQTLSGGGLTLPYSGSASIDGYVFEIKNNGPGNGLKGESNSGTGVFGYSTATGAANVGIFGESKSSAGTGTWGNNTSITGSGIGIRGSVESASGYSGYFERGRFYIEGNTGIGTLTPGAKLEVAGQVKITGGSPGAGKVLTSDVSGLASWQSPSGFPLPYTGSGSASSTNPVFQITNTGTGDGIKGIAAAGEGNTSTSGVTGISSGSPGIGVTGSGTATSGHAWGVYGYSASTSGRGIYGMAAAQSGTNYAVYGTCLSSTGYSGYFEGPRFYISGNLGVGVSNPSAKLDVYGQIRLWGSSNPGAGKVLTSDVNGVATWQNPAVNPWQASGSNIYYNTGNVGIGTSTPSAKLELSSGTGPQLIIHDSTNDGNRPGIQFTGNASHFISGDDSGNEHFGIYSVWSNSRTYDAKLDVYGKSTTWGKYIGFTHDGTNGVIDTDAGYIILAPSGQRVGINTTNPSQALHVVGNAYKTDGGTAWLTSSDMRLKNILGDYSKGLREIDGLQPVRYVYKKNNPRQLADEIEQVGLVAQDVQKIFPECITRDSDGYLNFNIHAINIAMINAIKELKDENDRLKAKIEDMRTDNEEMINRLEIIEKIVGASAIK